MNVGELRVVVHHHRVEGQPVGLGGHRQPDAIECIQARDPRRQSCRTEDVTEGAEELSGVDERHAEP